MVNVGDPYIDPATGALRNLLGAREKVELAQLEADVVFARALQLFERPVPATGDLAELQAIHRHLFQDVFSWAGEVRTVDMRKNVEGAEFFLPAVMIERAAMNSASELRGDRTLSNMDRSTFLERLSYHYDQWNYIHPFRDGNGRTQRIFWSRVANDAGWFINWSQIDGATNDAACRAAAEQGDLRPLRDMFDGAVGQAEHPAPRVATVAALTVNDQSRQADIPSADLSEEALRDIFDRQIRPRLEAQLTVTNPEHPPRLVILGGQPGAGKTRAIAATIEEAPELVEIVGDDLRRFHPAFDRILAEDPHSMPAATAAASGAWVHMSARWLREQGRSVLFETTLRQPDAVARTLRQFAEAGYKTELRILAVAPAQSRLSTLTRFIGQVRETGSGRWVPTTFHEDAVENTSSAVTRAVGAGLVDRVVIQNRWGHVLLDRDVTAFTAADDARAATRAIAVGRLASMISTISAREWFDELREDIRVATAHSLTSPELSALVDRLIGPDAHELAGAAFPSDVESREHAIEQLRTLAAPLRLREADAPTRSPTVPGPEGSTNDPSPTL